MTYKLPRFQRNIVLLRVYQDLSFKKDMNIICFSSNQSIGNGFVIPSGPLRENLQSLNTAHIVETRRKKSRVVCMGKKGQQQRQVGIRSKFDKEQKCLIYGNGKYDYIL